MEKLLPQNIEAEEGVLGSAIIDPEVPNVLRWLEPDDFYREAHRLLWRTMQKLTRQGTRADFITLCNALERAGRLEEVGGAATITGLVNAVPTSANAGYYAEIVANLALARRAIHASGQIAALAYHEHDPVELRRKALDLVVQATRARGLDRSRPLSDVLAELQEETYRRMEGQIADHLLLTGFVDLDRALVGMEPGQLVLLAGRPRFGKSALGQAILLHVARQLKAQGATVDYVTLEMTAQQQVRRMLSAAAELNTQAIRSGFRDLSGPLGPDEIDEEQLARFTRAVEALNRELGPTIYLEEQGLSVEDLQDHLIQVVSSRDCRFCLVDQLDLFAEPRPRLEQEQIAHSSKTLKQLAKDLHIVILCLVQLNRDVEHRTALLDRRPILSDLRYSGRLEQDADTVLFVHRPSLYQATYPLPPQVPNQHWNQYTEVIAAKVRDGASGEVLPLCFTGSFASFSDWPRAWELPQFEE